MSDGDPGRRLPAPRRVHRARRVRIGTPRQRRPGSVLDCLVLAPGPEEWAAVDLASGALVRARPGSGEQDPIGGGWAAYDLARLTIAADPEPLDPARPEAVAIVEPAERLGRLRRRPARRLLRRLASPERPGATLLGTHGPSIPYVDLDGSHPSLMLIGVAARSLEAFALSPTQAALSFSWSGTRHRLPVVDAGLRSATLASAPHSLSGGRLVAAMGGKPSLLLVGLGAVRAGHAPKVVLAALAP